MIDFKSVAGTDRHLLTSVLLQTDRQDADLSFVRLCSRQFQNCSSFAFIEEQLVFRFCFPDQLTVYTLPGGEKAGKKAIQQLALQAKEEQVPLYLYGIMPGAQEQLEEIFPDLFEYRERRECFDYIFDRKKMVELQGAEYHTIRNHIHYFRKNQDYRYTPLTGEMVPDCLRVYDQWCQEFGCENTIPLMQEQQAVKYILVHFKELEVRGGVLWVDGKITAFVLGDTINQDTFYIQVVKILKRQEGAYPLLVREFVSHLPENYHYVNLGEDGNDERRKMEFETFHPVKLLKKGLAVCAEGLWDRILNSR